MSERDDDELDAMLARAGRAMREEVGGRSESAARTRARVLASREGERRRVMWAMAAAAVIALGLGVPTVWAWSTGRLGEWLGTETDSRSETATETEAATETETVIDPETATEIGTLVDPETATETPTEIETGSGTETTNAETEVARAPRGEVDPIERRAYRAAHALHFEARDPAAALEAWGAYLDAYPRGRFALEARYNRALCLVRLERHDEARAALAPFAEGRHGDYRQREAAQLLEALSE